MIIHLNNIKFGHIKLSKYQIEYFDNFFIPFIQKKSKDIEKIIITGDIFYNNKNISFEYLNKIKNIFDNISNIEMDVCNNDYCTNLIFNKFNKINNFDSYEDFSLFHTSKNEKIGFYVTKDSKSKFIENNITPKFVTYIIDNIEDIDKINIKNDFVSLMINSNLLDENKNKNLIEIFLNNNPNIDAFYTEKIVTTNQVKIDTNNINIRNILKGNIDVNLHSMLNEIFEIHDEKNNN